MNRFFTLLLALSGLMIYDFADGQTGPNLLGAKGTFSAPFITENTKASSCTRSGSATYNPPGNIGNALNGCSTSGSSLPCSGYNYVYKSSGLQPEFTYTIIKNIGDINGGNCIKGDWRGQDHTGDGGYFMAVNGAPNNSYSNIFYQIKSIPVCPGTQYEFSAWVLNILPKSSPAALAGSEPNISFKVITGSTSQIIGTSGPIAYTDTPTWVKVGGTFTAPDTVTSVDLQVINATAVASGNDLGLDDISFNVVQSNIAVEGPQNITEGNSFTVKYVVNDITHTNTWYKWQVSKDGGATYTDTLSTQEGVYAGDSMVLSLPFNKVTTDMNDYKYRLVVSTSAAGLVNATCTYINEYTLIVAAGGPLPITLSSFTGRYANGVATLSWQTSQEINSDYFELFKSADGENFDPVANIKSAGFSNVVKNYSYQDYSPNPGEYVYYRLKQVDIDGKYTFSSVVKLTVGSNATILAYPNPFTSEFTVSLSADKTAPAALKLLSITGQVMFSKTISINKGNNSILVNNLPSFPPGIYYMSITNDELNVKTKLQRQ
ncbi:MAG TPA: T9SS type A sorting domain-containing protein [Chitinophagaceae bacterium]|nr:T9SS type A sorting domain-containing protein [Chitinophagaceae bacterium]